jgi:hypothetical protein
MEHAMRSLCLAAVALGMTGAPASAWDCPPRKTVYEAAEAGAETIRFSGPNLILSKDGQEQTYQTSGNADATVKAARLASESDAPKIEFFMVDVSRIAGADEPDELLIFDNRVFWPTCQG